MCPTWCGRGGDGGGGGLHRLAWHEQHACQPGEIELGGDWCSWPAGGHDRIGLGGGGGGQAPQAAPLPRRHCDPKPEGRCFGGNPDPRGPYSECSAQLHVLRADSNGQHRRAQLPPPSGREQGRGKRWRRKRLTPGAAATRWDLAYLGRSLLSSSLNRARLTREPVIPFRISSEKNERKPN